MKTVTFILFCSVLVVLSGCTSYTTSDVYWQGNRSLFQSGCVFQLSGVMAQKIHSGTNSNDSKLVWAYNDVHNMNALLLTYIGNGKPLTIDSIQGSYEDASTNSQPLKVVNLSETNAVFLLNTNFPFIAPRLEFGKYRINLEYSINGQSNACNFVASYVATSKKHHDIIWPWELPLWWAYHNGGGP